MASSHLTDAGLKAKIPLFVEGDPDDHKCGSCSFRLAKDGKWGCAIVNQAIDLKKGTCGFWAKGSPASQKDESASKMDPSTAGYIEKDGHVNCGTCRHLKGHLCVLWNGLVGADDCCISWEGSNAE